MNGRTFSIFSKTAFLKFMLAPALIFLFSPISIRIVFAQSCTEALLSSKELSLKRKLVKKGYSSDVAIRIVKSRPQLAKQIAEDEYGQPLFLYRGLYTLPKNFKPSGVRGQRQTDSVRIYWFSLKTSEAHFWATNRYEWQHEPGTIIEAQIPGFLVDPDYIQNTTSSGVTWLGLNDYRKLYNANVNGSPKRLANARVSKKKIGYDLEPFISRVGIATYEGRGKTYVYWQNYDYSKKSGFIAGYYDSQNKHTEKEFLEKLKTLKANTQWPSEEDDY